MRKLHLCLILLVLMIAPVYAVEYFSDRMNFPLGASREHNQTLTNDGTEDIEIDATIPSGFSLSSSDCASINATLVRCAMPAGTT